MAPRMVLSPRDDHAVIHSLTRQLWPIKGRRKEVHGVGFSVRGREGKKKSYFFSLKHRVGKREGSLLFGPKKKGKKGVESQVRRVFE